VSGKHTKPSKTKISRSLVFLLAAASGAVVANLYYNQPLLAEIARELGAPESRIGLIPTMTQIGYGLGLLFFTPLGDRAEQRRLIVIMVLLAFAALALTAIVNSAPVLIGVSLLVGLFSIVPQLIVPFAANLAAPEERSKTVGSVMSGLIIGILLARTFSGFVGAHFGWRAVYVAAAILMLFLAFLLRLLLPVFRPVDPPRYKDLIFSLPDLLRRFPILQEAAITGALLFACFSAFWTTLIFRLEAPPFYLGSQAAGIFGLVGAAGASAAALSGRFADRMGAVRIVFLGLGLVLIAWIILLLGNGSLLFLALGAVVLDLGAQGAHIANQARIFALLPEARSRINTIYIVSFFIGGAFGSLTGAITWANFGWNGVCLFGIALMVLGIAVQSILAGRRKF
jgi:predicted MFS family arabinose efflux permease